MSAQHARSNRSGNSERDASADRAHDEVLRRLRSAGEPEERMETARAEGQLGTLAVESALGGTPRHTLTHVARSANLEPRFLRQVMTAHGRPDPAPREPALTDEDIEFARLIRRFLDFGLSRDAILEIARVLGQSMTHTADPVRRHMGEILIKPGDSELTLGLRYAEAADELAPLVGPLLEYHFRAHVRDGLRRELITEGEREAGQLAGTRQIAVAFADLFGYTRLGHTLSSEEIGAIAIRLAELDRATAKPPVQLIKTIGDAAMLVCPDVQPLLDAVTTLIDHAAREGQDFPALRAGMTFGPATPRGGDWFGATINLARRITDVAKPGRVVVAESVRNEVPDQYEWKRTRRRALRGIDGRPRLYSLEVKP
jgi:adenylate cyclase